jgi:hypothetical protein
MRRTRGFTVKVTSTISSSVGSYSRSLHRRCGRIERATVREVMGHRFKGVKFADDPDRDFAAIHQIGLNILWAYLSVMPATKSQTDSPLVGHGYRPALAWHRPARAHRCARTVDCTKLATARRRSLIELVASS